MKDLAYITGDFGKLAKTYEIGRRNVPEEIVEFLWSLQEKNNPSILDVGCGTGLITRQLAEKGALVVGTDVDSGMIAIAREHNPKDITYHVAPAHKLPFKAETFDVVTISSAFHWFANQESSLEMKRVLMPGGLIFICNKNDIGDFSSFRNILKMFTSNGELPNRKEAYKPKEVLEEAGFHNVQKKIFEVSEYFSLEEVMLYFQTLSGWNLVIENQKQAVLLELEKYAKSKMVKGLIERKLQIVVLYGFK
jgi:ubiquinone/menaquinone biosynthesis C-methylase UbiE